MQLNVGTSDKKQYRLITLDNGLECLLIHEPPAEEEDEEEESETGSDDDGSDDGDDNDGDGDDDFRDAHKSKCQLVIKCQPNTCYDADVDGSLD